MHSGFLLLVICISCLALQCDSDKVYISVFRRTSNSLFNQREESFSIRGMVNNTLQMLATERALTEFRSNRTYEYCLPKTNKLIYDLFLYDAKGNGWDDGSYIEVRNQNGFLVFKGQNLNGEKEVYRFRLSYIIAPNQNWGVLKAESREALVHELYFNNYEFASFTQDYMREDENSPDYDHQVFGEPVINNFYVNYFEMSYKEYYAGLEIGITNDYKSVNVYLNNILVYTEYNHVDNHQNYYRILLSGSTLRTGRNFILLEFDKEPHINNVYLYGYPVYTPLQCNYIPYSYVVEHSPVVDGHDVNLAFDYSTDYFYFKEPANVHLTFANRFFDSMEIDKYIVHDYVFAYAPRNWTLSGSTNQKLWFPIDRQDQPPVDHIFRRYAYFTSAKQAYPYYKYTILENKGLNVVWLPELYPYVCYRGYSSSIYDTPNYSIAYNLYKEIRPALSATELEEEEVEFSIEPALPEGMTIDPKTGVISGAFDYSNPTYSFYTVTVKGKKHYQKETILIRLSEAFSFDSYVMNGKVYRNNRYTETPLFVMFIVFAIAACMILFFLMEVIQYLRL